MLAPVVSPISPWSIYVFGDLSLEVLQLHGLFYAKYRSSVPGRPSVSLELGAVARESHIVMAQKNPDDF